MKESLKAFGSMINIRQILIGLTVLLLGTLIYLIDRPPDQTYFVYKSLVNISLHNILPNFFGSIGNSLPSFVHVFSFILITVGLLRCQKRGCIIICTLWFLTDVIFESGQKFKLLSSTMVPDWLGGILFLENTKNYFTRGTFDYFDIIATAIGAIVAYIVLLYTIQMEKVHEK
jgi:hypothetical protein